jgi:hypothetical protein
MKKIPTAWQNPDAVPVQDRYTEIASIVSIRPLIYFMEQIRAIRKSLTVGAHLTGGRQRTGT